jgi:rod shape-determining protein MreD
VSAVTPVLIARMLALALGAVVVQTAAVSQVQVAGGNADLTPLVVMAVALLCGSLTGACFGFVAGLLIDVALLQTLGVSSLVLLAVGYGTGRIREARDPEGFFVPFFAGAAATLAFTVGFSLTQFLLGVEAPLGGALLRQILATVILNTLVALPLYALVRAWLTPSLPRDPRRRRRPASTTPISPLSQS